MKKILLLFTLTIILVGCGENSTSNLNQNEVEPNAIVQEKEDTQKTKEREEDLTEVAELIKGKKLSEAIALAKEYPSDYEFDALIYFLATDIKEERIYSKSIQ
ncbi:hypothetical protein [Oceanobacillus sp. FSL K6-0127]|uniref:hypothetical protein n=1 Tax=Oceanobacillus sp. FSL K6-0127 TaxID=2921420 RepID=UPI0030EBB685